MSNKNIIEQIESTLKSEEKNFLKDPNYSKLKEFYEEFISKGLAQRKEYDLPLLDTIGKRLFQHSKS